METTDVIGDIHSYNMNIKSREIYLHGHIGNDEEEDPGIEYKMASKFIKNIRTLDSINSKPILIHMFSVGGEWQSGMAIYDAIVMCKSFVSILVYGQAESMSSIVLQASDNRVMTPNAYFMSHYGNGGYAGNYLDIQAANKYDKHCCDVMLDIYANSFIKSKVFKESYKGGTIEKARNYLMRKMKNGDWYLNADDTIGHGFADYILGSKYDLDSIKNEGK